MVFYNVQQSVRHSVREGRQPWSVSDQREDARNPSPRLGEGRTRASCDNVQQSVRHSVREGRQPWSVSDQREDARNPSPRLGEGRTRAPSPMTVPTSKN